MDLIELAKSIISKATKNGADECDVFISMDEEFSVTVKDEEIESLKNAVTKGLGIRVFKDRKIGFAYTTDFSQFALEKIIDEAILLAKNSTPEPENTLSENYAPKSREIKIFDPSIYSINVEQRINIAKEIERKAKSYDRRIKVESTGFGSLIQRRTIANSNGFVGQYEGTIFEIYCATIATENSDSQTGFYNSVGRFIDDLELPENVAIKSSDRAIKLLNPRKIKTGKYPVIFDPTTAPVIISYIATATNGKNSFRKMSFLSDKIGEKVAGGKYNHN